MKLTSGPETASLLGLRVRIPLRTWMFVSCDCRIIIIIIKQKRENMHTDRCGNTRRQKCCAKGSGKEVKIQEFLYSV